MFKKIKVAVEYWDVKSFFATIIVLGALLTIGFFFFFSDIRDRFRAVDKETFKGRTIAKVISIKSIDKIKHGKYKGTRIEVDRYVVSYSYNVNGQTFLGNDHIPFTRENKNFIEELTDEDTNDTIIVAFDIGTPRNSILIESQ